MAVPKIVQAKCPTCGANLPVPPGLAQITCRYCQNVIHVEHKKPPPEVRPFGAPGAMPSRTLYIDPDAAAKAGRGIGCMILAFVLIPILISVVAGAGPWAVRSCKGAIRPFPVACDTNETVEVSGNWEGAGPIVTNVGHNCKLHIKNAKLKGTMLLKTDASNLELTLDNVQIETTGEAMIHGGSNMKVKIHGSTLTSNGGVVFDIENNLEVLELVDSTIESKSGLAFKSKYNLKLKDVQNSKIRGKKGGIDADSSVEIKMKKASEITSSDGIAIKASSGLKLEAEGGKIDGPEGALVTTSGTTITAQGLTLSSSKASAITTTSGLKVDYTDGSISSTADSAIEGTSGMELTLNNVKVQGVESAITAKVSSLKLKATKKTRIASTTGYGILTGGSDEITLTDSAIEAGGKAIKVEGAAKIKLNAGSRVAGKKGGIETSHALELEGTGATIDGGSGPGVITGYIANVTFKQGVLKGVPAFQSARKPTTFDIEGTRVDGEQKIPAR